ncbi:MAG: hypothetical protein MK179_20100, partial [Pirellulaceae bacterium]|nr:hypothetical protein [Pirellulaceae bacterium]
MTRVSVVRTTTLFTLLPLATTFAEVITVDDDGKADFSSIQAAIDYSSDGDEIRVAPGVYTDDRRNVVDFLGKSITVRSDQGAEVTIIDGEQTRRCIIFQSGEPESALLEGFTVRNGMSSSGGGIAIFDGNPTVKYCTITNNSAVHGGGMINQNSRTTLEHCVFSNNTAELGGGMYTHDGNTELSHCTFIENTADDYGGGMANNVESRLTLNNCTFEENSCGKFGGGMYNNSELMNLSQCTFVRNHADTWAGGMYNFQSNPEIVDCTFQENSAQNTCGGLMNHAGSNPILTNCAFIGNTTGLSGQAPG